MGYVIGFFVFIIFFCLLKDRHFTKQVKYRKTKSAASDNSFIYYGEHKIKADKWDSDNASYDGSGSAGGFDGGGGCD